jgi:hypothetical protein
VPTSHVPEPEPLEVDPQVDALARSFFDAVIAGNVDLSLLAEGLRHFLPAGFFEGSRSHTGSLGTPLGMYSYETRTTAESNKTYYRVRYPEQTLTWILSLDRGGKIDGFSLQHGWSRRIVSAFVRDVEY